MGDQIRTTGTELAAGWIVGTPKGQPRGRHVRGRVVSWAAAGAPVVAWRRKVERELAKAAQAAGGALEALGAGGRLAVSLRFVFPTTDTSRHGSPHTSKPDVDNLAKLWMDAAKAAGLLGALDDAAVAGLESFKVWGGVGGCGWTLRSMDAGASAERAPDDVPWWGMTEAAE